MSKPREVVAAAFAGFPACGIDGCQVVFDAGGFVLDGIVWAPIDAPPPQNVIVLLTGPSGIRENAQPTGKDRFVCHGWYDEAYRPSLPGGIIRWLDEQNDDLLDRGYRPTHWARALELPR